MVGLDFPSLTEFAKKGQAAQAAVDALLEKARKCPYCGDVFLPQSWNHKFCNYAHRHAHQEELKQKLR